MKRFAVPLTLALAGGVLITAPAAADTVNGATLSWRISDCAFDVALPTCGSLTETQSVTGNVSKGTTAWEFTQGSGTYDPATGATVVDYTGSVTIGNTNRGGYTITFADPRVTVAAGAGTLQADVRYRTAAGAPEVAVEDVKIVDLPGVPNATSWSVTPPWANVGTPGTPAPFEGKQFAQPLIDALPPSLKGWFWATGATGSSLSKAPGAVGVAFTSTPDKVWTPTVTVEGAQGVAVNKSATITVRGTGFDPAKQGGAVQGLYVVFGPNAASVGYGMSQASVFGAAQYLPVAPDANGAFETTLTITGAYKDSNGKQWNGLTDQLGVSTWAAHSHATTAWDTFTPISFTAAVANVRIKAPKAVKAGKRAVVRVKADGKGTVRVLKGKRVLGKAKLTSGVAKVRLAKMKPGRHTLRATYRGEVSSKIVLRVKR